MQYCLNEEQTQLQDLIRRVCAEKVAARAADIDRTAEYPQDMFELLQKLDLFTVPFSAEYGGTGSVLSACIAVEEFGRVCYNTGALLVTQWVPFGTILAGGSPEQQKRYLPGLATGELRGATSLTEAQSGSDVSGIKTTARRTADGYVINGAKMWCTGSLVADFIMVAARTLAEDGKPVGINFFIVERGAKGFTVGRKEEKLGARGISSHPLFFDNVPVAETARLGPEGGEGFKLAMETLNKSRPIIAARAVGLAQGAMDHTIEFIRNRRAFGHQISDFQGARWMVSDMAMKTEAARQLVYRAAAMVDAGVKGSVLAPLAAQAKCYASDVAMQVATDAVQLFGAAGISGEYPINRYFRDAKVIQIVEGTNQIQRNIIADSLLGRVKK